MENAGVTKKRRLDMLCMGRWMHQTQNRTALKVGSRANVALQKSVDRPNLTTYFENYPTLASTFVIWGPLKRRHSAKMLCTLPRRIWKPSFIFTVKSTVHTNPSRKRSFNFLHLSSNRRNLTTPALRSVQYELKTFQKRSFSKTVTS